MTIELLEPFFGFTPEMWRLSTMFREEIFRSFAKSGKSGMIFTYLWAFNRQGDWNNIDRISTIFKNEGAEIYFVELETTIGERLKRNKTPNRLNHKPTKRNIEQSESLLLSSLEENRFNSLEGEIKEKNYVRINNTEQSPEITAMLIKEKFDL